MKRHHKILCAFVPRLLPFYISWALSMRSLQTRPQSTSSRLLVPDSVSDTTKIRNLDRNPQTSCWPQLLFLLCHNKMFLWSGGNISIQLSIARILTRILSFLPLCILLFPTCLLHKKLQVNGPIFFFFCHNTSRNCMFVFCQKSTCWEIAQTN